MALKLVGGSRPIDPAQARLFFLGDLEKSSLEDLGRRAIDVLRDSAHDHASRVAKGESIDLGKRTQLLLHYSPSSRVVLAFRESPFLAGDVFKLQYLDCPAVQPDFLVESILSHYKDKELIYVASGYNSERGRAHELEVAMRKIRSNVKSTFA